MKSLPKAPLLASLALLTMFLCLPLAGCTTANKVKKTLALNDLHTQAAVAEEKGDDQRAYELWSEYVERRPQSAMAEYRLGRIETRMGLYRQAIGHLRVAHDLQPGNVEYIEGLADALLLAGEHDALMSLMRETVEEGEEQAGYMRTAKYAQEAGLLDEAQEALQLAIVHARGESPEPYMAMADFARRTGNTEAEIQNLRYALWFDRTNEAILARFEALEIIPGPSLALEPVY